MPPRVFPARLACWSLAGDHAGADVLEPLGRADRDAHRRRFPLALDADGLDAEMIARERKIAAEKAAGSDKPAEVQDQDGIDGAVAKFAKDNALLSAVFVMDNQSSGLPRW